MSHGCIEFFSNECDGVQWILSDISLPERAVIRVEGLCYSSQVPILMTMNCVCLAQVRLG